ncbi:MAG: RDD family protein [Pyrinomonadaceae bacterium]
MNSNSEKNVPAKRALRTETVIVDFDAQRLKAPFLLRCGAFLIDYILLVSVPVIGLLIARYSGEDGAKLLNSEINSTGWLIALLLGLTNLVIFPMFSGQSLGKMLTGLRVVNMQGDFPSFGKLLLRNSIGYLLTMLTGGLGFLFSVFNNKGRALHDLLAGTIVIYGQRKETTEIIK